MSVNPEGYRRPKATGPPRAKGDNSANSTHQVERKELFLEQKLNNNMNKIDKQIKKKLWPLEKKPEIWLKKLSPSGQAKELGVRHGTETSGEKQMDGHVGDSSTTKSWSNWAEIYVDVLELDEYREEPQSPILKLPETHSLAWRI